MIKKWATYEGISGCIWDIGLQKPPSNTLVTRVMRVSMHSTQILCWVMQWHLFVFLHVNVQSASEMEENRMNLYVIV